MLNCKLCTVSTLNGLDYLELGSRIRNGSAVRRLHLGLWNPNYSDAAGSSTQRHSKKKNTNNNNANTKLNKIRNELSALCTLINDRMSITTRTHTHTCRFCVYLCVCVYVHPMYTVSHTHAYVVCTCMRKRLRAATAITLRTLTICDNIASNYASGEPIFLQMPIDTRYKCRYVCAHK